MVKCKLDIADHDKDVGDITGGGQRCQMNSSGFQLHFPKPHT